jgi:prepilin-type N-terminal cleavage/methylation domain-containing protein
VLAPSSFILHRSSLISNPQSPIPNPSSSPRRGFTLVELLVVIVVIGMLSGIVLAALRKAQQAARLAHTKATVVKLDRIIMAKYEAYRTRRVPLNFVNSNGAPMPPLQAAAVRMQAIRDLMRMEMPERYADIAFGPLVQNLPEPALHRLYAQKMSFQPRDHEQAKCLYLAVMSGNPENRALFTADEISVVDDGDGQPMPCFVDGWGKPIGWLRWAPGFTPWSDIQIDDTFRNPDGSTPGLNLHHDPFDPRMIEQPNQNGFTNGAYQLFPLVFAGVVGKVANSSGNQVDDYGITLGNLVQNFQPTLDPYNNNLTVGQWTGTGFPITNHHIDQR